MKSNSFSDVERLQLVAQRIKERGVDLTASYGDWIQLTFACASLGEQAREAYHTICEQYPKYSREECDEKFSNCLKTGSGRVTLATLMMMAKQAGIDISMPRGRRGKSETQRREERANSMLQMRDELERMARWRFNVWRNRPEWQVEGGPWQPVQDRDLDTIYCRLRQQGLGVKAQDVRALIFSRDFCTDYDAVATWLNGLKPWNPDTDPDYLRDFYVGHLEFGDPDNEDFYDRMFKIWHVGMVALMLGRVGENPLMPIFKGEQHIGKTFFVRHILPPGLQDYRLEVGPSERIDKDLVISLSETPFILFDEISFGSTQKSEAFKYIVTSTRSNLRDAYAHFREPRQRRATLCATTNDDNILRDAEGNRRYLVVDLKETVDLDAFPLPYEGAYAQALYLLDHGFDPKPSHDDSLLISAHNQNYMEANDCEEALRTFLRKPQLTEQGIAMSAGDIQRELSFRSFRGREYNASQIGKAMKHLNFDSKMVRGNKKYLVVKIDPDEHDRENRSDAQQFGPDVF